MTDREDLITACVECGQPVLSNDGTPGHCPGCAPDQPSHGTAYQRRQAAAVRADEHRQRIIDNLTTAGRCR
jgi:hypothetical protein